MGRTFGHSSCSNDSKVCEVNGSVLHSEHRQVIPQAFITVPHEDSDSS